MKTRKTKKITKKYQQIKHIRIVKMDMNCYVFACDYENDYDGATVIAPSMEKAIEMVSERTSFIPSEWRVEEVLIPKDGIIIENSIPEKKDE